jgi:hypothetical protein
VVNYLGQTTVPHVAASAAVSTNARAAEIPVRVREPREEGRIANPCQERRATVSEFGLARSKRAGCAR